MHQMEHSGLVLVQLLVVAAVLASAAVLACTAVQVLVPDIALAAASVACVLEYMGPADH